MDGSGLDIIEAGRAEVRRMRDAIARAEPDARVTLSAGQFAVLADLIDELVGKAATRWDEPMNDTRYYVPLDHFRRIKGEADRLASDYDQLRQRHAFDGVLGF